MNNLSDRPQNKNFGDRARKAAKLRALRNETEYYKNPKKCKHCNSILPYRSQLKFCNKSCSASYNNKQRGPKSLETRERISKSLYEYNGNSYSKPKFTKIQFSNCDMCRSSFYVKHHKNIRTNLCKDCKNATFSLIYTNTCECCSEHFVTKRLKKYCNRCTPNIRIYRHRASFAFNVYDYPDEFNIALIEKFGWYSPNGYRRKNKQPNLNGVSRDHLYSIKDGFLNNVDPKVLSHPANCQILKHNGPCGNNKKNSTSSITLDQLKVRISAWDSRHSHFSTRTKVLKSLDLLASSD